MGGRELEICEVCGFPDYSWAGCRCDEASGVNIAETKRRDREWNDKFTAILVWLGIIALWISSAWWID